MAAAFKISARVFEVERETRGGGKQRQCVFERHF